MHDFETPDTPLVAQDAGRVDGGHEGGWVKILPTCRLHPGGIVR